MILCSNCQHKEFVGALFCSECGNQLVFADDEISPSTLVYGDEGYSAESEDRPSVPVHAKAPVYSTITLYMIDTDEMLPLSSREEVTLGRISEGQPIIPDVDLSPYEAYEAGVSRLHASIKFNENKIAIVDLGSANGTRVNGKKIEPNTPQPLTHGDVLTLGKLKVQVLLHS